MLYVYTPSQKFDAIRILEGEGTLLGSPLTFGHFVLVFKSEENKYFLPHAYCFIYYSDLSNPNFVEKKIILYCFS